MNFIEESFYKITSKILYDNNIKYKLLTVGYDHTDYSTVGYSEDDSEIVDRTDWYRVTIDNISFLIYENCNDQIIQNYLYRHGVINNMVLDDFKTEVIFRKEYDNFNGNYIGVLAVFPYLIEKDHCMTCYAHMGQHSGCAFEYYDDTEPCNNPDEYKSLYDELTSIGYNLKVIKRINRSKQSKLISELNKKL